MRIDEIGLLEALIKIYSPTYQEAEAVRCLVGQMQELGFDATIDQAGNAIGTRGCGENEILFLGHIDTVPGVIPVRRDGDLLFGRGSVDAKGPLACFTVAAAQVLPPPGWRVTVVGAVAEEGDSRGAMFLRTRKPPRALVIGEPSKWDKITLGFKGSLWVDYSVRRPVSHTASVAESASEAAVGYWNQVKAWCDLRNTGSSKAFTQLTPSLRGMGSATDGFSENAWLKINLRLPPSITVGQVSEQLEASKADGSLQ
ncbi:MAG: M20/M25/M40 family metallo-hydrolase, partial [Anaerolineaceae bacterium]|nr:M20/M25/M40 family metallo-hydrolase [Anaerolineaceae bacterium]